jgi:hypothetical protein
MPLFGSFPSRFEAQKRLAIESTMSGVPAPRFGAAIHAEFKGKPETSDNVVLKLTFLPAIP